MMGLNKVYVFGLVMVLVLVVIVIVGIFLGVCISFDFLIGGGCLIFGFEVVIIGGFGNFWGIFVGGVILGVV